jgi:hypothetical protein
MISHQEMDEFAEADKYAEAEADRLGSRPKIEPHTAAIFTAIGVYFLLKLFSAVTVRDLDLVSVPLLVFTAISGGVAYLIPWWRERQWRKRYHQAFDHHRQLREIDRRRQERWQ